MYYIKVLGEVDTEKGDVIYTSTIFKHSDIGHVYFTLSICIEWGSGEKEKNGTDLFEQYFEEGNLYDRGPEGDRCKCSTVLF